MWRPCDDGGGAVDALNEMANPEPADLHIVGIERGDRIQEVRAYMTSRKLSFFTLVADDIDALSQIYDPSIEDILIDPEGRIVFVGAGDSLRNAYLALSLSIGGAVVAAIKLAGGFTVLK
jgi:hypothetical protein